MNFSCHEGWSGQDCKTPCETRCWHDMTSDSNCNQNGSGRCNCLDGFMGVLCEITQSSNDTTTEKSPKVALIPHPGLLIFFSTVFIVLAVTLVAALRMGSRRRPSQTDKRKSRIKDTEIMEMGKLRIASIVFNEQNNKNSDGDSATQHQDPERENEGVRDQKSEELDKKDKRSPRFLLPNLQEYRFGGLTTTRCNADELADVILSVACCVLFTCKRKRHQSCQTDANQFANWCCNECQISLATVVEELQSLRWFDSSGLIDIIHKPPLSASGTSLGIETHDDIFLQDKLSPTFPPLHGPSFSSNQSLPVASHSFGLTADAAIAASLVTVATELLLLSKRLNDLICELLPKDSSKPTMFWKQENSAT